MDLHIQVVKYYHIIARVYEQIHRMRTDESCSTRDKNSFNSFLQRGALSAHRASRLALAGRPSGPRLSRKAVGLENHAPRDLGGGCWPQPAGDQISLAGGGHHWADHRTQQARGGPGDRALVHVRLLPFERSRPLFPLGPHPCSHIFD